MFSLLLPNFTRLTVSTLASTASQTAQLVLSTGSRAGLIAPVHLGYYLIGRDRECQIRPKTRSVSRLHCLVYFGGKPPEPLSNLRSDATDDGTSGGSQLSFHVLDLNSTSGTKLNGHRILPRKWHRVENGTELRCGKIAWQVVVPQPESAASFSAAPSSATPKENSEPSVTASSSSPSVRSSDSRVNSVLPADEAKSQAVSARSRSAPSGSDSAKKDQRVVAQVEDGMLSGGAWQEADVAAFLAAHDDADRENRYESIRSKAKLYADDDSHVFDDEPLDSDGSDCDESVSDIELSEAPTEVESPTESADVKSIPGPKLTPQEQSKKDARDKAEAARKAKAAKKKKADAKRAARVADDGTNPLIERIKFIAAVTLAVCVLGLAIYQAVQFSSGPPPKVVEGID